MGLETGTFIADLNQANPTDADLEAQGAAHLRLIKKCIQNTFPRGTHASGLPTTVVKSATFTIASTDSNTTFLVDTTSAIVNATLPSLGSSDAGWSVSFIKTNTGTNPLLVKPPSGTLSSGAISGLAATRRCIPGVPTTAFWTGTAFICTRAVAGPVGSCIEFHGTVLPVGFEWPNGQTLASASTNYPDYNSIIGSGVTLDRRERLPVGGRLGLASPGRISSINTATIGNAGGNETITLTVGQLPAHRHSAFIRDPSHGHTVNSDAQRKNSNLSVAGPGVAAPNPQDATITVNTNTTGVRVNDTTGGAGTDDQTALTGSGNTVNVLSPMMVTNFILVVE